MCKREMNVSMEIVTLFFVFFIVMEGREFSAFGKFRIESG